MVGVFDDPLPKTFIMEEMFAWKKGRFGHILETHHACVIMMFLNLIFINFLKVFHSISEFLDPIVWSKD